MTNYGKPREDTPIPEKRKSDIFSIIKEEREFDCKEDETAMLERVSEDREVTPVGFLPFTTFSSEDLFASVKTICEDYNNHIKNIK